MSSVADAYPSARGRLAGRIALAKERVEAFLKGWEWTWGSAVVFSLALTFFIMITIAVIPSFWLYFADQKLHWNGAGPLGFWLLKARDAVAAGLFTGPVVTILVVASLMQNWRRKLRGGASAARPSGGYR